VATDQGKIVNRGEGTPSRTELDAFLADIGARKTSARGRLIFGLDATASRENTWDTAAELQAEMFREVAGGGGLDMQLVFYRGINQCQSTPWTSDANHLTWLMSKVMCQSGHTQIEKILKHVEKEDRLLKVAALTFVGDACEENPHVLVQAAHELGRIGVPAFMFQEGDDREAKRVFQDIARVSRGAYCRFDPGAAHQLAELLRAVAVYAVGGLRALTHRRDAGAIKLLSQLK